jgi:MFS family permease
MITAAAMLVDVDRRMMMGLSYLVQLAGSVLFVVFGDSVPWLAILGALLFGLGIGNATSLPPLIAQKEFAVADVLRVVSLMIATSQATASVAPTLFGLVRQWGGGLGTVAPYGLNGEFAALFAVAAVVQATAIACFLAGRGKPVETRERAV